MVCEPFGRSGPDSEQLLAFYAAWRAFSIEAYFLLSTHLLVLISNSGDFLRGGGKKEKNLPLTRLYMGEKFCRLYAGWYFVGNLLLKIEKAEGRERDGTNVILKFLGLQRKKTRSRSFISFPILRRWWKQRNEKKKAHKLNMLLISSVPIRVVGFAVGEASEKL